jgi:hypothetical protein
MPRTQEELDVRNSALAAMQTSDKGPSHSDHASQAHNSVRLPDYTQRLRDDA